MTGCKRHRIPSLGERFCTYAPAVRACREARRVHFLTPGADKI